MIKTLILPKPELARKFLLKVIEKPETVENIPSGATIVLYPVQVICKIQDFFVGGQTRVLALHQAEGSKGRKNKKEVM